MELCLFESDSPEENLAMDEALLDAAEQGAGEVLRLWEARSLFVVVGYGNSVRSEVRIDECRMRGVPVLRRCSGGGTVVQMRGCLNYAVVLNVNDNSNLSGIASTNRYVMERQSKALNALHKGSVEVRGYTDLAVNGLKISGNSQRRKRACVLFHGTILLTADLPMIGSLLKMPSRQPDYRANRSHEQFLMNFPATVHDVKQALADEWGAGHLRDSLPIAEMRALVAERYGQAAWNERFY